MFFRTHYTNARLAKIYPYVSDACGRCDFSPANHVHMFWSCAELRSFWSYIFDILSRAYGYVIAPNSLSAVFGIASLTGTPKNLKQALAFTTLLARRLILPNWKLPNPPARSRWVVEVLHNLKLEKLRFTLKSSLKSFHVTWDPFLSYIHSLDFSSELED